MPSCKLFVSHICFCATPNLTRGNGIVDHVCSKTPIAVCQTKSNPHINIEACSVYQPNANLALKIRGMRREHRYFQKLVLGRIVNKCQYVR